MPDRTRIRELLYRHGWRGRCSLAWGQELVRRGLASTLGLLFPPVCCLCAQCLDRDTSRPLICPACRQALQPGGRASCPRCARPLPQGAAERADGCLACRQRRFGFTRTTAIGVYSGLLREAVLRMKRAHHEPLTLAMGGLLAEVVAASAVGSAVDLLAPVPMHWTRRLLRGVNGPEILIESLSARLAVPAAVDLLYCRRKTRKQGTLLSSERRRNVRGAYGVSAGYAVDGARLLIVDDVMTSGATANEVCRVLLRAGASQVSLAVVARGVGFD